MRRRVLAAAFVALVVALVALPRKTDGGLPLRDFEAYYAAGKTWHYQGDPYGREVWRTERLLPGVVAAREELLPFVGPPFGLPVWSALAQLPFRSASIVWAAVLGLAFTTLALGSLLLGRSRLVWYDAIAVTTFAAAFAPLTGGVSLGQVAILSCAAIVAMPFLLGPRLVLAAAGAGLLAALQPNLALVLAARLAGARAWIALVSAALIALGASALALGGPASLARYAQVLRDQAAAERFIAIQTTPGAVARSLGATAGAADALAIGIALAVGAIVVLQVASRRYAPDVRLALACAAAPLALPFAHEHDFTISFMPAILLVTRARGIAWLCAAFGALALGVDWLGLAQRPGGLISASALAVAGAFALAALAPVRLRPYHFAPLLLPIGVTFASFAAAQHPLPTWPDALPASFALPPALPSAAVWHLEQVRSGIAAMHPVWGALRLVSLAACTLLWVVTSVALRRPANVQEHPRAPGLALRTDAG